MKKRRLEFSQLPDPLSRFRVSYSEDTATVPEGHEVMDPYGYFYDDRFEVIIRMQDGSIYDNY